MRLLAALLLVPLLTGATGSAGAAGERPPDPAVPALAAPRAACDPLGGGECALPFPNDWHTRPDPTTPTGRRLALRPESLPRSAAGEPVDPAAWNRADGFSPGSTALVHLPGLDAEASGLPPVTDIGRSLRPDAPVVLLDAATGERWPHWAELDSQAPPDRRALLIHPARNLHEGHRYVVALRHLRAEDGSPLPATEPYRALAGRRLPAAHPLRPRQLQLTPALDLLARSGIAPRSLTLAWDFTVASRHSLTGDLFSARDDALRALGDRAPGFRITATTDPTPERDPLIGREVTGKLTAPNYLALPGGPPGSTLLRDPRGVPRRNGDLEADFRCVIPRSAFRTPARPALYGHGLLGSLNEVGARNVRAMAAEHGFAFCATDWIGMAKADVPVVLAALADVTGFQAVPDRSVQGILNAVLLGRALTHPDGLPAHPALRGDTAPLLDPAAGLVFDGNSQGGILGGALVAADRDIRAAVLGVTGMNYGLLLNRSSDFAPFQAVLGAAYPDPVAQQVVIALMQLLWDRAETNGCAPLLRGRKVLLHLAFGDHQVANAAAEVQARTAGVPVLTPSLVPGRSPDVVPHWGIRRVRAPHAGSALVLWDSGTPAPPPGNVPPTGGHDPHEDPRHSAAARAQKAEFLRTGRVVDVCDGAPCTAEPVER
ncbi:hypothetical protein [Actinosynnema pretiosum]|uniref:Uncharacterized protein n=1 Tax=Actinosynnema pretiosum TaxID=42197 RepID=A0A290ZAJ3_9PSEU|nr:hypothetical protein [Actinosynnema pretiosum]ATE56005.1 hypothetical protein CNX65_24275 [Actinosynnema pretiosum]